jgi:hypothetical protein
VFSLTYATFHTPKRAPGGLPGWPASGRPADFAKWKLPR